MAYDVQPQWGTSLVRPSTGYDYDSRGYDLRLQAVTCLIRLGHVLVTVTTSAMLSTTLRLREQSSQWAGAHNLLAAKNNEW